MTCPRSMTDHDVSQVVESPTSAAWPASRSSLVSQTAADRSSSRAMGRDNADHSTGFGCGRMRSERSPRDDAAGASRSAGATETGARSAGSWPLARAPEGVSALNSTTCQPPAIQEIVEPPEQAGEPTGWAGSWRAPARSPAMARPATATSRRRPGSLPRRANSAEKRSVTALSSRPRAGQRSAVTRDSAAPARRVDVEVA